MAAKELNQGPLPQHAPSPAAISKVASDAAAAAAAVALSRVPCHPLDTLKCKLQASSSASGAASLPFKSVVGAIKHTYMREGVAGFYRGFGVALTGALYHLRFNTDVPHPRYTGTMPAGVLYANPLVCACAVVSRATLCRYFVSYDLCKNAASTHTNAPPFIVHMARWTPKTELLFIACCRALCDDT